MATKRILLARKWSGHEAGEIVEEQDFTVDSMVRKGYGVEIAPPRVKPRGRGPAAETAVAPPAAETMDATPQAEPAAKPTGRKAGD